ncbi:MAG: phosphoribosylformylglycinamidine synthase subunit PurQ [Bacteroidota bacterium]
MKFGVVIFPGSNCDHDMVHVLGTVMEQDVVEIWHKETDLGDLGPGDCVVLPGGFSFGDYLRCGAIASFSPIMKAVINFANNGGFVWGICNGFQVLCESGLLPGVLLQNEHQKFVCKNIYLRTETKNTPITQTLQEGQVLKVPIAHADGRYHADEATLNNLALNGQILFRYVDEEGNRTPASNPNGSVDDIAGICNATKNVFGMMPHPERCAETALGNDDGRSLFEGLIQHMEQLTVN